MKNEEGFVAQNWNLGAFSLLLLITGFKVGHLLSSTLVLPVPLGILTTLKITIVK
jgi:hypothetical protein